MADAGNSEPSKHLELTTIEPANLDKRQHSCEGDEELLEGSERNVEQQSQNSPNRQRALRLLNEDYYQDIKENPERPSTQLQSHRCLSGHDDAANAGITAADDETETQFLQELLMHRGTEDHNRNGGRRYQEKSKNPTKRCIRKCFSILLTLGILIGVTCTIMKLVDFAQGDDQPQNMMSTTANTTTTTTIPMKDGKWTYCITKYDESIHNCSESICITKLHCCTFDHCQPSTDADKAYVCESDYETIKQYQGNTKYIEDNYFTPSCPKMV